MNSVAVPVGIRLYLKEDYCKKNQVPFKTKNQLTAELIEGFRVPRGVRVSVVFDSRYLNKTVVDSCHKKGYPYISQSKNNRTIYVEGRKFSAAQLHETTGELCLYLRHLLDRNRLRTIFKYSRTKEGRTWLSEQLPAV